MKPTLNIFEALKACFAKYAKFSGRARRSEFWWFYLICCIPSLCLTALVQWKMAKADELTAAVLQNLDNSSAVLAEAESADTTFYLCLAVIVIVMLLLLIPMLSVWCRRLHDVGKSGHFLWLFLVCGVGGLVPLVMAISDGTPGTNQYGPNPKEE